MEKIRNIFVKKNLNSNFEGYCLRAFNINSKVINFSPGPTQIPRDILNEIKNNLFSKKSGNIYGITPLEISHRSPEFNKILNNVNDNMKKLMLIPDNFALIWTQGGGHGQFSSVPLNFKNILFNNKKKANYAVTGTWSERAFKESLKFVDSYDSINSDNIPISYTNIDLNPKIDDHDGYVYICSNETVNGIGYTNDGISYPKRKDIKQAKLIIDMSSDFGTKKINWNDVDMAFACTSKNFGNAGANIAIIRKSLLNEINQHNTNLNDIPSIMDWNLYYKSNSLYNTPAIFNIYIIDKIINYYISQGGIESIEITTKLKAELIYNFLDNSKLFRSLVKNKKIRSNINIPFFIGDGNNQLRSMFLDFCYKNNVVGLRTKTPFNYNDFHMIEPLRISLYNGISIKDTKYIIYLMKIFEEEYNNII